MCCEKQVLLVAGGGPTLRKIIRIIAESISKFNHIWQEQMLYKQTKIIKFQLEHEHLVNLYSLNEITSKSTNHFRSLYETYFGRNVRHCNANVASPRFFDQDERRVFTIPAAKQGTFSGISALVVTRGAHC